MSNLHLLKMNILFSLADFVGRPDADSAAWKRPMGPQYRPAYTPEPAKLTASSPSSSFSGAAMPDFLKFVVTMRPASLADRADTLQLGSGYARVLDSSRNLE